MTRYRVLIALALSAAVAAGCSEAAAPQYQLSPRNARLSSGVQKIDGTGRALGHCFRELGIDAPILEPTADATTLNAPAGQVVTRVAIKAPPLCLITPEATSGTFTFDGDGAPCYVIAGLGTPTATVTRVGRGRDCKKINKLQFLSGPAPVDGGDGGGDGDGDNGGGGGDGGNGSGGDGGGTGPGSLVVCAAASTPVANASLGFSVGTPWSEIALFAVPVGGCSEPLALDAGEYVIAQGLPEGYTVQSITSDPLDRLVAAEVYFGYVTVQVANGARTTVTFMNDVAQ